VGWEGESEGKRQKLMDCAENSLTEWQREKKKIIILIKKHIQHTMFSPPSAQLAPE